MSANLAIAIAIDLTPPMRRRIAQPLTPEQIARRAADQARDEWNRAVELKKEQKKEMK